jgi:23S rRNA (adenine2503-C2)-methyltransferase
VNPKPDIRSLTHDELQNYLSNLGEKQYRIKQIEEWLWQKAAKSFDEMTSLPLSLREKLKQNFEVLPLKIDEIQRSTDGTCKLAIATHDQKVIEGVLIPTTKRMTACISSQVGCSLACKFCATGKLKRLRNLTGAEIFDQVVAIDQLARQEYQKPLSNIVMMGMGEPLLNYREVKQGIERITSPQGLGMSPKRITLSTAGIAKMIRQMADDGLKVNLALSLHAANDEKRSSIMPINDQNNLRVLQEALNYYFNLTKQQVTFEYIIFKDFNDSLEDAKELLAFCRKVPSKVNIIEYNSIDDGEFQQADADKVDRFAKFLENNGIVAKVRRSRGKDIDAACGQLANKNKTSVQLPTPMKDYF